MIQRPTRGDKDRLRQKTRLTRPPRMESVVKNAMSRTVRKQKRAR